MDGAALADNSPRVAAAAGIGMVHQHFSLVPSLTVAENIMLGREPTLGPLIDRAAARAEVWSLATRYKLAVEPNVVVGTLSVAAQQKVEILKALARRVRLLILDEPTAVLTPQETDELFDRLRDLRAAGLTIIFISHKLREVRVLAASVTVLRGGVVTGDAPLDTLDDDTITRMVMGRDVVGVRRSFAGGHGRFGPPVLEVAALTRPALDPADRLDDMSFAIAAGQILGIAGVEGNGQRGLVQVLTGLAHAASGSVHFHGRDLGHVSTADLRALGMAHLPADRFHDGGARSLSLTDNAIGGMQRGGRLGPWPLLLRARAERIAAAMIKTYNVRARGVRQLLGALSGGNAQKLIAAREFGTHPKLLIVDQPTRGIDVEAAAFIRARIIELAGEGAAVLLITADLDELLALSDHVIVLFGGRIVARLGNDDSLTPERLGPAMLGLVGANAPATRSVTEPAA